MTEIKKIMEQVYLQEKHQEAIHCGEALLLSGYEADANLYFMLGTSYSRLEQYDKAISNLAESIKLKPDYAQAHHNLGVAYGEKGDYDKAVEAYNQAIKLDPDKDYGHYKLRNAYYTKEWYVRAIVCSEKGIEEGDKS
jgi:tetratricopeptide (TPR) repeat protein